MRGSSILSRRDLFSAVSAFVATTAIVNLSGCGRVLTFAEDGTGDLGQSSGDSDRESASAEDSLNSDTISVKNDVLLDRDQAESRDVQLVKDEKSVSDIGGPMKIYYAEIDDYDARAFGLLATEFSKKYPRVSIERFLQLDQPYSPNTMGLDLHEKISNGEAPDVFQAQWGRATIEKYVEGGKLIPVDDIFQTSGLLDQYPDEFLSVGKVNGNIWGVPMSLGRSNLMWFDQQFFDSTGISNPSYWTNWDEAFEAMNLIKGLGVIPFSVSKSQPNHYAHIFENILLSELGPLPYSKLLSGEVSWLESSVSRCLNILKKLLVDFSDLDARPGKHRDALDAVLSKRSVLTICNQQGLKLLYGKRVDTGVSFCPSPGTRGVFSFMGNAFYVSRSATNVDAATAWLTMTSNRYKQDQYNQMRVSLPPRFDADKSMYTDDQRKMLHDWKRDYIVPSVVFGSASEFLWRSNFINALQFFSKRLHVESVQKYLADQCSFGASCR